MARTYRARGLGAPAPSSAPSGPGIVQQSVGLGILILSSTIRDASGDVAGFERLLYEVAHDLAAGNTFSEKPFLFDPVKQGH